MLKDTSNIKAPSLVLSRKKILEAIPGSVWASEMVLNPSIIEDPKTGRIHMLFRATGPFPEKQRASQPLPFPIFLGYGWSDDRGRNWSFDTSRPALSPRLAERIDDIYIKNKDGKVVVNHANGCIEDPRLFFLEGRCMVVVACRMFPPGPYWLHDDPVQCAPKWSQSSDNPFGIAASHNVTVNVLYEVNLEALAAKCYEEAFSYLTHVSNPDMGENRDVVFFPEKLLSNNKEHFVCIHRPWETSKYRSIKGAEGPCMLICSSESLSSIWMEQDSQTLLAQPLFDWEGDRIGASGPLLRISENQWLLSYHGKKNAEEGYSQSFMIIENCSDRLPIVKHRCPARIMVPVEDWEMPRRFKSPVVFVTGMIAIENQLLLSYGAADEKVGVAFLDLERTIGYVSSFDAEGNS